MLMTGGDPRHRNGTPMPAAMLSSVEHTGDTEEFRKAADMTDDDLPPSPQVPRFMWSSSPELD